MKPKNFMPVEVNPQSCSPEEAEVHLRGFAESFIDKHHSERWIHLLIEKPEKAEKALHKFVLKFACCFACGMNFINDRQFDHASIIHFFSRIKDANSFDINIKQVFRLDSVVGVG